jgi:hypothetical protein
MGIGLEDPSSESPLDIQLPNSPLTPLVAAIPTESDLGSHTVVFDFREVAFQD